ncbi:MAG TPA: adenylate cyclase [Verrucomicrobiae bacterium]|nr:adenylate cyclase [Verrucomicrobiae bacterium]
MKHRELERKFLVRKPPPGWRRAPHSRIVQGYFPLSTDRIEIRLRRIGSGHFLTVKAGRGRLRLEEDIELKPATFKSLWPLTAGRQISKTRYKIPWEKCTVEMDVYAGPHRGLVTADIEFESRPALRSFTVPDWFGPELTGNRRYANEALAERQALP